MFTLAKLAVMFSAALSVAAIPSHMARQAHRHREVAARVAQPEPEVAPLPEIVARDMPVPARRLIRKRSRSGNCNNSSNSAVPSSPAPENSQSPPSLQGNIKGKPGPSNAPPQDTPTTPSQNTPTTPPQDTPTTPTSTPAESPKPTTTPNEQPKQPETTTPTPSPTPASGSGNNNGGGQTYSGQGTFYSTGLGACGITNNDGQDIAAVSHLFFDSFPGYDGVNPNNNPLCNKMAKVTYQSKTIYVTLTDRCEGCAYGDLDFSPHAFDQLADPSAGRIDGIVWEITS